MSSIKKFNRFNLQTVEEGVVLYKIHGDNKIDKPIYLKQRDSFLKNYRLYKIKYNNEDFDIGDVNVNGYIEKISDNQMTKNYIPSLEEENRAFISNYDNLNFLFYKYKALNFLTHYLNTLYSNNNITDRSNILNKIVKKQIESLMSATLDLFVPKSYVKINDEIILAESGDYLLYNVIDLDSEIEVYNFKDLCRINKRFMLYPIGYSILTSYDNDLKQSREIEYLSASYFWKILKYIGRGQVSNIKDLITEFEECVKDQLDLLFKDFSFVDKSNPIKRINVYPLQGIVNLIGDRDILERIVDGYKLYFKCGENYIEVTPDLNRTEINQHMKIENNKVTYSENYNIVFSVKAIDYEIEKEFDKEHKVTLMLKYKCNNDIMSIFNLINQKENIDGMSFYPVKDNRTISIENNILKIELETKLSRIDFDLLTHSLVKTFNL